MMIVFDIPNPKPELYLLMVVVKLSYNSRN